MKQKILPITLLLSILAFLTFSVIPAFAQESSYTYELNNFNQSNYENQMLNYINQERQKEGLPSFKMAPQLVELARMKSQDMITNKYFSHNSPTFGSPFDMMKKFGISYGTAGENLAGHYSVLGAHQALMNSAGHKKNILNPSFTHIGLGIVKGGQYGMMFTQLFTGEPKFSEATPQEGSGSENNDNSESTDWNKYLIDLINAERQKNGLAKLSTNDRLSQIARLKGEEMVEKSYLAYRSPTYGYMEDMLKTFDIPFLEVKENIVGSPDVKKGHEALMNSSRHKGVILNPDFSQVGVAVVPGGNYGFNIIEIFLKTGINNDQDSQNPGTDPVPNPKPTPEPKPEPVPTPKPVPAPEPQKPEANGEMKLETQMIELINKDRTQKGLAALKVNGKLTEIARMKAKDMEEKGYLGYTSPTYGRTAEILSKSGISYSKLAESIVAAGSIESAHNALMAAATHKGNILNSQVQEVGVGIVKSARYGYIMVEIFIGAGTDSSGPKPEPKQNPDNTSGQLTAQEEKEQEMLELINKARKEVGIAPLAMDQSLVKVARIKSQDMIDKKYFAHNSPTYGSPFEMMDSFGIKYRYAGENLAGHYSVSGAHEALMNSAGHRKNILNPNFTHIGIGIVDGGPYNTMFTQMFVGY